MPSSPPPPLAEAGIEIDSSETERSYLRFSAGGAPLRISPSAHRLLSLVGAGLGFNAIARELSHRRRREVTARAVEEAYRRVAAQLEDAGAGRQGNGWAPGFWCQLRLLPARAVERLAAPLARAFHPLPAALVVAVVIAAVLHLLQNGLPELAGGGLWAAYPLFLLSLLFHELGHASASVHFGIRPGAVGFVLYLIYPAFYSDVTRTWRLRRRHRLVVDLGGVFFQLAVGALYETAFLLCGWMPLRLAFLAILGSCLFSLNPVFRLDGYWLLADALGVVQLGCQPARMLRHLAARLRRRSVEALPWPAWVGIAVALYTPLSLAIWGWFAWRLVRLARAEVVALPKLFAAVRDALAAHTLPAWSTTGELLFAVYGLTLALVVAGRSVRPLTAWWIAALGPPQAAAGDAR